MSERSRVDIDRLNLRLPAGYEARAEAIARRVGRELAGLSVAGDLHLASLEVPRVRLAGGETDAVIARRIARAVRGRITEAADGGVHER